MPSFLTTPWKRRLLGIGGLLAGMACAAASAITWQPNESEASGIAWQATAGTAVILAIGTVLALFGFVLLVRRAP